MDTWCDMVSYTARYMAGSIAKLGLQLDDKPGEVAWLTNGKCTIRLSNIDNDYVRFEFWNPADETQVFMFSRYLNCLFDYRGLELSPNMPRTLPAEEQFVGYLVNYDRLLCEGYFQRPLDGDFSWVEAYHGMLAEETRLKLALGKIDDEGHPEADAIWRKKVSGNPAWMQDVRRILAEKGPKP